MNIFLEKVKSKKYLIAGAIVLAIAVLAAIVISSSSAYADVDYWNLRIGNKTVAVLSTESQAKSVIKQVKQNYIKEGAKVEAISCDPKMTIKQQSYRKSKKPNISSVKETVKYILIGTKAPVSYTVKKGDSLWSISQKQGFTVDELKAMNKDMNLKMLYPGDKLKLYKVKPFITVKSTQTVTSEKKIKYKTVYKESSEILTGTEKVERKGTYGKKQVTEQVTMENDQVIKTVVKKSKVLKQAKDKVVLKGTGTPDVSEGDVVEGNGQAIANYALQFVGNPYVYGGSSLTNGADCSGFVMAVYQHFGISLPHNAGTEGMGSYGRSVSLSEAQPGDLICYGFHIGIYIGGGQVVHAINEGMGIGVTGTSYIGSVIDVRRIVG